MRFIAHRGNLFGPLPELENRPEYIQAALAAGFDVELDIWSITSLGNRGLFLGHDRAEYPTTLAFLLDRAERLWIHAKNLEALTALIPYSQLNVFSHDTDPVILTSKRVPWVYPGAPLNSACIRVMPERYENPFDTTELANVRGYCSDYIGVYRRLTI